MSLLPGVAERLARAAKARDEARERVLQPRRVDLPTASGGIRRVQDAAAARELLEILQSHRIAAIAVDSEYSFGRPAVSLNSGKEWTDIRSQRPICVSLAAWVTEEEGYVVRAVLDVRVPEVVPLLGEILRLRVPFVFHHVKVELFTLWALGLDPDIRQVYDTFVAAATLNLGRFHKRATPAPREQSKAEEIESESARAKTQHHLHSLVGQCQHYGLAYPFSESKEELRDLFLNVKGDEPLSTRTIEYSAADAEWTLRLYAAQEPDVFSNGLQHHLYSVEFPFAVANARIEWNGVHVDDASRENLRAAAANATAHYAEILRGYGIDPPGSRDRFLALMGRAGLARHFVRDGKPCTEDELLEPCESLHPAVRAFRLHQRYQRLAGEEWLTGCMTGADGRVHPAHFQLGAATGRNSCRTPNLVGIGKGLRPVVTAPTGRALIELDYGQIEVGVAAAEHGDSDLIAAFNSGDVYVAMAQRFYASLLTEEERALSTAEFKRRRPDLRNRMKTFVLAVLYNVQAPHLAAQFGIPLRQAKEERERFLDLYPALKRRLEESSAFGAARGCASMVSGLRRLVDGRVTQWVRNSLRNTPIQGSATVVFKLAVVALDRAFRATDVKLVLPVHDAVVLECSLEQVDEVAERAKRIMEDALRSVYPVLVPKVDVNRAAPWCWNKDGHADSLERFLADPTFSLDRLEAPAAGFPWEPAGQILDDPERERARFVEQMPVAWGGLDMDAFEDLFERYQDRAAIHQHDGGFSRADAERLAVAAIVESRGGGRDGP